MALTNTFYSVAVNENAPVQKLTPRLGLLREQTGVPLFVFFSLTAPTPRLIPILNLETLEQLENLEFTKYLTAFFKSGGNFCYLLLLPISSEAFPLGECIGTDNGYQAKTGAQILKLYYEMVDLICFPQVGFWETEKATQFWKILSQQFQDFDHYFFLMDLPIGVAPENACEALPVGQKQFAAFAPFLFYKSDILPPSLVAAALFQRVDKEIGTHENPTLFSAPSVFEPLERYSSPVASSLLEARVNFFRKSDNGDVKLWGAYTLADPFDLDFKFISSQRTFNYFKETLEELCEPFLMEPLVSDIDSLVEVSLYSALQSTLKKLNLEKKFKLNVGIARKGSDDILQLNAFLQLPLNAEEVQFSLLLRS